MSEQLEQLLATPDLVIQAEWEALGKWFQKTFQKTFSIEGILFFIGLQEAGTAPKRRLEKEVKQDLIVLGTYHVLATLGLYAKIRTTTGEEVWQPLLRIPKMEVEAQEKILQQAILAYFKMHQNISFNERLH